MLNKVTLNDKYILESGRILLTGTQALVLLTLLQRRQDISNGLKTAGYVTGYRGSPLGSIDREFGRAKDILKENHVKFKPAVNEDLAATALWGSQQVNLFEGALYDGVFGIWYGKGPGVDRSGDVFRHANFAGTSPLGGVLALTGDDPACKSSTVPSQSEYALIDANIPVLNPSNLQDILDFGLWGIGMSRFSGCWIGMKCIIDNVDTTATVDIDPNKLLINNPKDFEMPEGGLHIRWPDQATEQEFRLQQHKTSAALAFARTNRFNRITLNAQNCRFGIIASGKTYLDVLQALKELGIENEQAQELGLRLLKVAMPWPLEKQIIREFAEGLEEVLVIEEKRPIMESQIKDQLFSWQAGVRPRVVGKHDTQGNLILPSTGELNPTLIARVIAKQLKSFHINESLSTHLAKKLILLEKKETALEKTHEYLERIPYFCSGCPHNTSTKIPSGSRAAAGIGCHYMSIWMDRDTATFTQMGGEGANWLGQAPFTSTKHIFVNIGDGTYFHSGILAIRAAIAANVNMTYKILYNDAVAMTGGQPMDGPLDVPSITWQVRAEGVNHISVVSDKPDKYSKDSFFAPNVTFHHRDDLDSLQKKLRNIKGVSVLIYDQTCAAELRRKRKRGLLPNPTQRPFINAAVCEGCGDCGVQSNCVAISPLETELGRKRTINQSSCNKDFSCLNGFCPAFVSVENATPRTRDYIDGSYIETLPEPNFIECKDPYSIFVTGIGGTGVVTIGAILSMAAHLENKGVSVLDVAGLAQKNGAVYSHIRIANQLEDLYAVRIANGSAKVLIGNDLVASASEETIEKLKPDFTSAVINSKPTMTPNFTSEPDLEFPEDKIKFFLNQAIGHQSIDYVDATGLALDLLGDTIAANTFLLGFTFQKGLLPVSSKAIEKAIELNNVSVDFNKQAFLWGRLAQHDPEAIKKFSSQKINSSVLKEKEFAKLRAQDLENYHNVAYARRYKTLLDRVYNVESKTELSGLGEIIEKAYFKLLAYKDEYEVARLYTDGSFKKSLEKEFQGPFKLKFHLAPPFFAKRDPSTGELKKQTFGQWVLIVFKILAKLRFLRGTPFDPFGYTIERKTERQLIKNYENIIDLLVNNLNSRNHSIAIEIASLPLQIRGFGHIKERSLKTVQECENRLLKDFIKLSQSNADVAE